FVQYTSDTEGGSSGSCVFNNEWKPIALHHATKPADHLPAGERNAEGFLNEGVKLSAIATHLEELSQDGSTRAAATELLRLFHGADALMGFFGSLGRESALEATDVQAVVDRYGGEANDIDFGFWNIAWFNRDYRERLNDVARVILALNLDVWA